MKNEIPFKKSIMMDKVLKELKEMISTIIVKLDCEAERNETLETRKAADEYIVAMKQQDSFYSYENYSMYALSKLELDSYYMTDKRMIPKKYRTDLVRYQRQFVIGSYVEKNNYYRTLAGLPELGDKDYIYVTEVDDKEIEGVDITKPIHEMTDDEIIILNSIGYLDIIINNHPEKKYLNHLIKGKRIDIVTARTANDYSILYIYSDKTKQPITEMFINIYEKTRSYVLDRFYDDAYKYKNDYYENYIGLFILTITVQRFITNYFHKFINRDFYDKDIIKLLFDSYGLPFYNDIPLSYSQKVAKNLNRLLYYKSSNRVFVDIFKLFDMDNIEVFNYVLFKNPKIDDAGKPLLIYNEKTDVGYQINTNTYCLEESNNFVGSYLKDYTNVKKIIELKYKDEYCKVILLNNGIINFETDDNTVFYSTINNYKHSIDDYGHLQFDEYYNVKDIKKIYDTESKSYYVVMLCKQTNLIYTFKFNKVEKIDLKEKFDDLTITPSSVLIKQDEISFNKILIINKVDTSLIYFYKDGDYYLKTELDETVVNGDYYDNAISLAMSSGKLFLYGDNKDYRLLNPDSLYLDEFTEENHILFAVKDVKILLTGCIFILKNGTIRFSRSVPFFSNIKIDKHDTDLAQGYKNIKTIFNIVVNNKLVYCLMTYSGNVEFLNYKYTDDYGELLFDSDYKTLNCKYDHIRDISYTHNNILITTYGVERKIIYSGLNENNNFPFIGTLNMITENNELNIEFIQLYKDLMFFTTYDNKLCVYKDKELINLSDKIEKEEIQNLVLANDSLYILTGKKYMYKISGEDIESLSIEKKNLRSIAIKLFSNGRNDKLYYINEKNEIIDISNNETKVLGYNLYAHNDNIAVEIKAIEKNNRVSYKITYNNGTQLFNNINIENINKIFNICLYQNILFIESDKIYFIKLNEISVGYNSISPYIHEELTKKCSRLETNLNNLIIYNKFGGISIIKGFIHSDRLDAQITSDYISLFDEENVKIRQVSYNENNIFLLKDENSYVTYEEAVDEMYDLSFIEVPMDCQNKAQYIADTSNELNYDLVVSDDKLWGGDLDKKVFLKEILKDEFNYYTSKYISINSTYELMQLNFEVCYMFRMLTELKENEKYLTTNVKYVGENVPLFDIVVGLFALTCKKFGLEGNVPNTKTKILTVLGFNFSLDMKYIDKIIKDAKLQNIPLFNEDDIKIKKPPKLFLNPADEVNLYLDNEQVMENIYDYKWKSKNIKEYNAWKRIQQASLYSNYVNEIYRLDKFTIAPTYLEYLRIENPPLYNLVNDADPNNLIEETDYLLLALSEYLSSDKYKYLFLKIPSLSMDLLRKFIFYLIDIFKSYTVDLKAMNIIYHIDDKRINNIKLILDEDGFKKHWDDHDKIKFKDLMNYTLERFQDYDKLKLTYKGELNSEFTADEIQTLIKYSELIFDVYDERKRTVIKDFSDYFTTMSKTDEESKKLNLQLKEKFDKYFHLKKELKFKEKYTNTSNLSEKELLEIKDEIINQIETEEKERLFKFYSDIDLHGILPEKLKLEFSKFIDLKSNMQIKKSLLGDFNDYLFPGETHFNRNDKINIKDNYYFIRNE